MRSQTELFPVQRRVERSAVRDKAVSTYFYFFVEFLTEFLIISEKIIPDLICLCNRFIKELELENLVTIQMH